MPDPQLPRYSRFDQRHQDDDNKNKSGLFSPSLTDQAHLDAHAAGAEVGQSVPPGAIMIFAGPSSLIPPGWLRCQGAAVSREEYSDLFAAIGTEWGVGDGSKTFNIPDLRNVFPLGSGTKAFGTFGGSMDHDHGAGSLSTATNGDHNHAISGSTASAGSHSHSTAGGHDHSAGTLSTDSNISADTDNGNTGLQIASLDTHTHNVSGSTGSVGGHGHGSDGSHSHGAGTIEDNVVGNHTHNISGTGGTANPPYAAIHFIIKT